METLKYKVIKSEAQYDRYCDQLEVLLDNGYGTKSEEDEIELLTLLIACINFMNLSTAMAERRAREVGLRKVLGASRRTIIGQFLGEAQLLSMLALVLSIGLARLVLPGFAAFAEVPLYKEFGNGWVWAFLVVLGLFTGLVAGSYPALYLSRFQPAKVLKRLMSIGRKGARLRKGLVTFQFVISIFLVITSIVVVKQTNYLSNRPVVHRDAETPTPGLYRVNSPCRHDHGGVAVDQRLSYPALLVDLRARRRRRLADRPGDSQLARYPRRPDKPGPIPAD